MSILQGISKLRENFTCSPTGLPLPRLRVTSKSISAIFRRTHTLSTCTELAVNVIPDEEFTFMNGEYGFHFSCRAKLPLI